MARLTVRELEAIHAYFAAEHEDGEQSALTAAQSAEQAAETERRRLARMAMQEQLEREGRSVFVPPGDGSGS